MGKYRPPRQKDTLRELNVRPTKERGQNFLIDPEVPRSIVQFADFPVDAKVVEIGPGTGALTECLGAFHDLTLVEIEPSFCEHLTAKFPHAAIVNADIRQVDLSSLGRDLHVFGNIPYVFSSEIVFHLIKHRSVVKQAVMMTQKEFAERIAASPHTRAYGSISVSAQLFADVELGPIVPGTSFHPPTEVESRVMKLRFREAPRAAVDDYDFFQIVVRAAFSQRRKKLINSLMSQGRWSKEVILGALEQAGISPDVRAETLSVEAFAALAVSLSPHGVGAKR
jgi:16S rRNA (adenine1518-N6/adenine1519-N6)-dimethyltransferase